jgi:hypothetical protein
MAKRARQTGAGTIGGGNRLLLPVLCLAGLLGVALSLPQAHAAGELGHDSTTCAACKVVRHTPAVPDAPVEVVALDWRGERVTESVPGVSSRGIGWLVPPCRGPPPKGRL